MTSSFFTQIGSDIDGEAAGDYSGDSVSLSADGSVVAIGAVTNGGNGTYSGHVRIYRNVNGTWTQVGSDIDGEAAGDLSGGSVSLSADGSVVAIGARQNDGNNGSSSGHVRIYQNINGIWSQIGSDIDGEAFYDYSGYSVSLSSDGSVVAIGAEYNEGTRIYQNIGGTWTQVGSDIDGEASYDYSGKSVSLSSDGSVVAIGATLNDGNGTNSGHVSIYQNVSGNWTRIGDDIDGESAGDESGYSVSLSSDGSVVAIGARQNDGNGSSSGHVRIYQNINGIWSQIGSDIDGEASYDKSGESVSLSADGSVVAIGAGYNDGNGSSSGHVRIYQNINGIWSQIGSDIDGEASYDNFGESVSLSADGSVVAIGAKYNDGNGSSSGHVRIYVTTTQLSELQSLTYIASNPDLITTFGTDTTAANDHYNTLGKSEGRALDTFNATQYLSNYSDLAAIFGTNTSAAIQHYILNGFAEGRTYRTLLSIEQAWSYLASNGDLISSFGANPESAIAHYISNGEAEGRSLDNFDEWQYLASNEDLISGFGSDTIAATQHYVSNGYAEGRSKDNFDEWQYLASNEDLISGFGSDTIAATQHYVSNGYAEGRSKDNFDEWHYLASNADLITTFGSDITAATQHYVSNGYAEGRSLDTFDEWGYLASNNDLMNTFGSNTTEAIKHYISHGLSEGRVTNSFNVDSYLSNYADINSAFGHDQDLAKKHFIEHGFAEGRVF